MRIVSWNIRSGGGVRAEAIGQQLERWQADIVALQEFRATPPSRRIAGTLAELGLQHQRTTARPETATSNALLVASRWPLRLLRPRVTCEPGRWLLLRVAAPEPFALGSMHVPNMVSGRKYPMLDALLALARGWRGGPALLIGDTNSGRIGIDEESSALTVREEAWMTAMAAASWADAFRHLHGDERAYTWYSPNAGNGFRLDEAFVNRALLPRLREARHAWGSDGSERREALSDHAALIVELG